MGSCKSTMTLTIACPHMTVTDPPKTVSAHVHKSNPWIGLSTYHTSTFGYYILWLKNRPLDSFVDLSKPLSSFATSKIQQLHALQGTLTQQTLTTIASLADTTSDYGPTPMPPPRKLLHAYFLGTELKAPYFQDAVMNALCLSFTPDVPPPQSLVTEVYERCPTSKVVGIKKLLIDYYIFWQTVVGEGGQALQTPPLSAYPVPFFRAVTTTLSHSRTKVSPPVRPGPYERIVKEYKDVAVDFSALYAWLRDAPEGRGKCRYHLHGKEELCFNRIV